MQSPCMFVILGSRGLGFRGYGLGFRGSGLGFRG